MRYGFAFFDLDGTLTQSEFGIIASARYALSKFGIDEPDRETLLKFIGPPLYYSFEKFYGISGSKAEEAIKYYREYYEADAFKDAPVFEGIPEALSKLKDEGVRLVVVTSKPERMAKRVIEYTGLDKYFEHIVGPSAEKLDPSKADLIKSAMELTGASCENIVMIGDRHYDIGGANETGVDSIGVVYGYGTENELKEAGATHLAYTPEDIYTIVAG